jgi:WD40 repeat protein
VAAVTFSPDGKSLAVGTYGEVAIWDLTRGEPTRVLTNVLGAVHDLRYSPDGRLLAVAGGQPSAKGDLRLFQVGEWKLQAVLAGHEDTVASVAFSPDGKEIASGSFDKTVRLWDASSGKLQQTFTHHSDFVHAVAWTPDGKGLFSVSKDRSARLFDPRSGASRLTFSDRDQDALALAVSPDGKTLAVSGLEPAVTFWNTETGAKLRTGNGHRLGVYELAWSRDGSLLASAGTDGTVKLWNEAGSAVRTLPAGSLVYAVALSPDGKVVASGSFDGLVRLFDTTTGRHLATLLALPPSKGTADWLALTPQGYSNGSPGLLDQAKWSAGGEAVASEAVWKTLRNPEAVRRALRRETLSDPVLGR